MEEKQHYFNQTYMRRERLQAYIDQIDAVNRFGTDSRTFLEIGKGNGYLSHVLTSYYSRTVKTVDIDPALKPDYLLDISSPEFSLPETFDIALCFEVLEHVPWDSLPLAVDNMLRYVRNYLIVSVPDANFFAQAKMNLFWLLFTPLSFTISIPRFMKNRTTLGSDHQWEIGIQKAGKPVRKQDLIRDIFGEKNLADDYRGREFAGHHFFILRGKASA